MIPVIKIGRLFYGIGMIVYGIHQLVIMDFRPQVVPDFPAWAHRFTIFPLVTGIGMIIAGVLLSGITGVQERILKKTALFLGVYFLALIILCHIPYLLFVYPHKLSHLGSWGNVLKTLAFSGGAFVVAGSFSDHPAERWGNGQAADRLLERGIPLGRLFFCTTIILFGCNHFVYDISAMVPKWYGMPTLWSYFGGAALILSGTAILLKLFLKPVALLLALMLFLWFLTLHAPNAIADPYSGQGNRVVSAFDALLFCGTALILSQSMRKKSSSKAAGVWTAGLQKKKVLEI